MMRSHLTIPHRRPTTQTRTLRFLRTTITSSLRITQGADQGQILVAGPSTRRNYSSSSPVRPWSYPRASTCTSATANTAHSSPRHHPTCQLSGAADASNACLYPYHLPTRGIYPTATATTPKNTVSTLRRRGLASIQSTDYNRAVPSSALFTSRNTYFEKFEQGNICRSVGSNGNGSERDSGIDNGNGTGPPDERTLKLGKTIRILQERLPTLLASPLPQEILSPHITLHLFPSTHPHLPTVSGRVAYLAALWTAPVAWGRVPIVGNVKLIILSERMVKGSSSSSSSFPSPTSHPQNPGYPSPSSSKHSSKPVGFDERLIVKWRTCGKTKTKTRSKGGGVFYRGIGAREQVDKITEFLGTGSGNDDDDEFTGLFIFEFDDQGRILSHTIEHVDESGNWDTMARFISVTDWLLGKARWKRAGEAELEEGLALGFADTQPEHVSRRGR